MSTEQEVPPSVIQILTALKEIREEMLRLASDTLVCKQRIENYGVDISSMEEIFSRSTRSNLPEKDAIKGHLKSLLAEREEKMKELELKKLEMTELQK